jgi:hypothetical protein
MKSRTKGSVLYVRKKEKRNKINEKNQKAIANNNSTWPTSIENPKQILSLVNARGANCMNSLPNGK